MSDRIGEHELERIYDEGLAQATYLVGCEQTKAAIIVDPGRSIH